MTKQLQLEFTLPPINQCVCGLPPIMVIAPAVTKPGLMYFVICDCTRAGRAVFDFGSPTGSEEAEAICWWNDEGAIRFAPYWIEVKP